MNTSDYIDPYIINLTILIRVMKRLCLRAKSKPNQIMYSGKISYQLNLTFKDANNLQLR